jgi:hypothetical protein
MTDTKLFRAQAPRYMRQLIADFDFTVEDAAAIMGNAGEESAGFTKMQEVSPRGGRGGLGPFQWTGPRRVEYEKWCKRKGWAPSSFEAAYSFLWRELHGDEKKAVAAVKNADTLEAKVIAFERNFERAAADAKHYDVRLRGQRSRWTRTTRSLRRLQLLSLFRLRYLPSSSSSSSSSRP